MGFSVERSSLQGERAGLSHSERSCQEGAWTWSLWVASHRVGGYPSSHGLGADVEGHTSSSGRQKRAWGKPCSLPLARPP